MKRKYQLILKTLGAIVIATFLIYKSYLLIKNKQFIESELNNTSWMLQMNYFDGSQLTAVDRGFINTYTFGQEGALSIYISYDGIKDSVFIDQNELEVHRIREASWKVFFQNISSIILYDKPYISLSGLSDALLIEYFDLENLFCKEGKYKELDKYSIIYKFHRVDITDFKILKKKSEILDYNERHRIIEPLYL